MVCTLFQLLLNVLRRQGGILLTVVGLMLWIVKGIGDKDVCYSHVTFKRLVI